MEAAKARPAYAGRVKNQYAPENADSSDTPTAAYRTMDKTMPIRITTNWAMVQFLRERFSGELLTAQTIRQIRFTMGMQVRISVPIHAPTDISVVVAGAAAGLS